MIMLKNFRLLVFFSIAISNNVLFTKENTVYESSGYQATITRDKWGVPHIFGKRDEDAAFGLAYAHADDDIKNIAFFFASGFDSGVLDKLRNIDMFFNLFAFSGIQA